MKLPHNPGKICHRKVGPCQPFRDAMNKIRDYVNRITNPRKTQGPTHLAQTPVKEDTPYTVHTAYWEGFNAGRAWERYHQIKGSNPRKTQGPTHQAQTPKWRENGCIWGIDAHPYRVLPLPRLIARVVSFLRNVISWRGVGRTGRSGGTSPYGGYTTFGACLALLGGILLLWRHTKRYVHHLWCVPLFTLPGCSTPQGVAWPVPAAAVILLLLALVLVSSVLLIFSGEES